MTTKHTPGPWLVLNDSPPAVRTMAGGNIAPEVCTVADARLIAAAPDMLAALEGIAALDFAPHSTEGCAVEAMDGAEGCEVCRALETARAALAKAKGE